ncbi:UbiA family prenyltransferase [Zavarzinella formosa]|uniref:UbiA family prenyltransferase n=1 Tax=Zavarzinella formosa TaxID=360055 RepID=UPI0002EA7411|nr:UbiA family prenyltransferase [Zavarzinella formosa]
MKILPLARLLRLPNVFTAFADIGLGLCVTAGLSPQSLDDSFPWRAALLVLASGLLYMAGMVWNDWFDLEEDRLTRPGRPLPSGKISTRTASLIGFVLMLAGVGAAAGASPVSGIYAGGLVLAILAYDARIKRTPWGPLGMAACRFLNVLMGVSLADTVAVPLVTRVHLALTIGLYIVGVTWFARTEEKRSEPKTLRRAGFVMLAAGLLAVAVGVRVPPGTSSVLFPYLLVVGAFWVGSKIVPAIRQPTPGNVQAGVKRSIFGLVVLDALLASVFIGTPGLLLVGLLPPALLLGKWVYST